MTHGVVVIVDNVITSPPPPGGVRSIAFSMSVCLFVYLLFVCRLAYLKNICPNVTNFSRYLLALAVARSSSDYNTNKSEFLSSFLALIMDTRIGIMM